MTDPLSISASIGGLVTLADIVFRRIFRYVQAVKSASKDITALSSEIGALYGLLSNLNLVACQLDGDTPVPTVRSCHIESCYQTLTKVEVLLNKDSTSSLEDRSLESMKRKLRWPFTSSEVKTVVAEIERHKVTLGLALNADSLSGLLKSLSVQSDILESVNGVKTELKRIREVATRIAMNEEHQQVLKSFGRLDPGKNQRMSQKLRHPGTGYWLTESEEFRDWSKNERAKLWLHGIPGAGKTVLASSVIEEALQKVGLNFALGFFYCDYKDSATLKPTLILGSLVQQIAKQDEQSFEKVQRFCHDRNPDYRDDFDYDPEELRNLLLDIALSFDSTAIIIDGLDECGENMAEVTDLLASLSCCDEGPNIKTLFLSRNELDIRELLKEYTQVAIAATSSDLKLYVGAEIETRMRKQKLRIKDQSLKEYIMKRLIEGADGM